MQKEKLEKKEIQKYLFENDLLEYLNLFVETLGCRSLEDLQEIDEKMLEENEIKPIQRKKILKKIDQLKEMKLGRKKKFEKKKDTPK
jgi:hypothetical protein